MRIRAAVSRVEGGPLEIEELELTEELLPHEILVRIESAGVCHSDVVMRDQAVDSRLLPKPVVLGHEGAGVVEEIGEAVTTLVPGDKVILAYHADGDCPACDAGTEAYCHRFFKNNMSGLRLDGSFGAHDGRAPIRAAYHQQSSWATHSIATEQNAVKVETDVPLSVLGPLGCGFLTGYGAIRNAAQPPAGASFVAFGMGAVGLGATLAASTRGCAPVVAVDLHEARLEIAERVGASVTVNASEVDTLSALREISPRGFNYSFEATGVPAVMSQALDVLASGGRATLCGVVMDTEVTTPLRPANIVANRIVHGVMMGHGDPRGTIGELVEHIEAGRLPLADLVTYYDLDQVNEAIADSSSGKVFKAILRPNA